MIARKLLVVVVLLFAFSAFGQTTFETALKNLKFRNIGPAQMGGRVDDLAIAESDPRVIYVGAAAGGVFKSVNGGETWKASFEDQPNPFHWRFGAGTIEPFDPLRGTGEPNNRQSSSWGTDGGATWALTLFVNEDTGANDIAIDLQSPNIVYASMYQRRRTAFGFYGGAGEWNLSIDRRGRALDQTHARPPTTRRPRPNRSGCLSKEYEHRLC
jgi:hypothetical protein